uniref:Uncharacterized protein n=1 Tax=Globodera rostochiensis TaxID=31243 RepID=A0A914HQS6_GLORO
MGVIFTFGTQMSLLHWDSVNRYPNRLTSTCFTPRSSLVGSFRLIPKFGNDIFVVNGCATKHEHLKCVYDKLDPFCLSEDKRYEHCEYCEGSSCNSNKTELETLYLPKTVGTKSTKAFN